MIFLLSVFLFLTLHCRLDCSRDRIRFQNVCCLTGVKDVEKSDIEIEVVWSSSTAATVCSLTRNGSCSQPCKHNFNVKTFCWRSFKQTHCRKCFIRFYNLAIWYAQWVNKLGKSYSLLPSRTHDLKKIARLKLSKYDFFQTMLPFWIEEYLMSNEETSFPAKIFKFYSSCFEYL